MISILVTAAIVAALIYALEVLTWWTSKREGGNYPAPWPFH